MTATWRSRRGCLQVQGRQDFILMTTQLLLLLLLRLLMLLWMMIQKLRWRYPEEEHWCN